MKMEDGCDKKLNSFTFSVKVSEAVYKEITSDFKQDAEGHYM